MCNCNRRSLSLQAWCLRWSLNGLQLLGASSFDDPVFQRNIYPLYYYKDQYERIEDDVNESQIEEVPGLLVSLQSIGHKHCELEYEPEADEHDRLVHDLEEVAQIVHHGHHLHIVGK